MPRLNTTPRVGIQDPLLQRELREHATQVNLMAEGRIVAYYNAGTAPPPGPANWGDIFWIAHPVEQGTAGSKFIVDHWRCVAGGDPATWVQCCCLTGN